MFSSFWFSYQIVRIEEFAYIDLSRHHAREERRVLPIPWTVNKNLLVILLRMLPEACKNRDKTQVTWRLKLSSHFFKDNKFMLTLRLRQIEISETRKLWKKKKKEFRYIYICIVKWIIVGTSDSKKNNVNGFSNFTLH